MGKTGIQESSEKRRYIYTNIQTVVARRSECSVPVSESGCSRVSALDGNRNGSVSQMK